MGAYYDYDGLNVKGDGNYHTEEYYEDNWGLGYNTSTCPTSTTRRLVEDG